MFPAHVEDCASHSINYNFGPCSKIWFMVPPEFIKKVQKLVNSQAMFVPVSHRQSRQLEDVIVAHMDETRRADFAPTGLSWRGVLHSRRFWPHPRILRAAGIPVYCAIQEPATAIFTAAGYVHWGYAAPHPSGGHSFAVAWNTFPRYCISIPIVAADASTDLLHGAFMQRMLPSCSLVSFNATRIGGFADHSAHYSVHRRVR